MNDASESAPQATVQETISPEAAVQSIGKVESKTPGRMRVRVNDNLRTPENMEKLQAQLSSHPDVKRVTVNQRTGSVTVTHSKDKDGHNIFSAILQETTLLAEVVLEVPAGEEGGDPADKLDQQLADLMYRVDSAIYEKTGLRAKGRLFPATIAGLGVAQLLVYGISLETLPGPVLIWIGWDIYHRFGKEPPLEARKKEDANSVAAENATDGATVTA